MDMRSRLGLQTRLFTIEALENGWSWALEISPSHHTAAIAPAL
jgi:hypothetical protein